MKRLHLELTKVVFLWLIVLLKPVLATENIRIGIIHSLTGTLAKNEIPMLQAAKLALNEINSQGGLLGKQVEVLVRDSQSDAAIAAQQAEQLIIRDKVEVLYGCWASDCRKAILPIVEKYNHLFIYPMQYEGFEQSSNIIYTGLTANQQIIPAIRWAIENRGRRVYLIGSDTVFPRYSNALIRKLSELLEFEIIAESYLPFGAIDTIEVVNDIVRHRPDIIINTINGDTNKHFFRNLAEQQSDFLKALISFSLDEQSARELPDIAGKSYTVWSYYQQLDNEANLSFIKTYQKHYGAEQIITDPVVSAYISIRLWANTVRQSGSSHPEIVNQKILWQSLNTPFGIISLDRQNRHSRRPIRIAQHTQAKQANIIWQCQNNISPDPFPLKWSESHWLNYLGVE